MAARSLMPLAALIAVAWAAPASADDLDQCQDTGHPEISIPACTRLIDSGDEPASFLPTLYGLRALALYDSGDYARAIRDLTTAEALEPPPKIRTSILTLRGQAYLMMGQYPEAIADLTIALRRPAAAAFNLRGITYLRLKQYRAAIADFDSALRLQPRIPEALYGRGIAELAIGETARGERDEADAKAIRGDIAAKFEPRDNR